MSVLFECRDLAKSYGKVQALKGINLQLESGRIVGLLGPNGSGKTTLIKLANRLLQPSSGNAAFGVLSCPGRSLCRQDRLFSALLLIFFPQ